MSEFINVLVVIPARFASTRLPGKPLEMIGSKSMIHRVYDQAIKCNAVDKVVVATDDQRIMDYCEQHKLDCTMTKADHPSGTDRVAEVATLYPDYEVIINIQGDEPFIDPDQISDLVEMFVDPASDIVTQCIEITDGHKLHDFNVVKVVRDQLDKVLYFSRQAIPAHRDIPYSEWIEKSKYYQHIGIYGFRRDTLLQLIELPVSNLEKNESLEQLRWMDYGYDILAKETSYEAIGIDTYEDLMMARKFVEINGEV